MSRIPTFLRIRSGAIGAALFLGLVAVALAGPLIAPYPMDVPLGGSGDAPSALAPLGTDFLGRDVLSRLLDGGRTVIGLGAISTALVYGLGLAIGLAAGFRQGPLDMLLMRGVDVVMSFPSIVLLLLLVVGLGANAATLLLGVVLCEAMSVARLVRAVTLEIMPRGYVDVSRARGESPLSIVFKDVLPNIAHVVLADLGVRFGFCVALVASMNFLGLGLQPPLADWGLMIAENRQFLRSNPFAVAAPALLLAGLSISVNLLSDAYARSLGPWSIGAQRSRSAANEAGTP